MKYDFALVMKIGMNYNEETGEVKPAGVEFIAVDEDDEVIDMDEEFDTLKDIAKDVMKSLEELN
jgi:hypothetical protein